MCPLPQPSDRAALGKGLLSGRRSHGHPFIRLPWTASQWLPGPLRASETQVLRGRCDLASPPLAFPSLRTAFTLALPSPRTVFQGSPQDSLPQALQVLREAGPDYHSPHPPHQGVLNGFLPFRALHVGMKLREANGCLSPEPRTVPGHSRSWRGGRRMNARSAACAVSISMSRVTFVLALGDR